MNPDKNWKETRASAEDLLLLTGVPVNVTEEFLKTLENLIIHRFVESLADSEDKCDVSIELPYLGSLVVSNDKKYPEINFVPRPAFYRKIKNACHSLESPLTSQVSDDLSRKLVRLFEEGDESDGKEEKS